MGGAAEFHQGTVPWKLQTSVERFSPKNGVWEDMPSMPYGRFHPGASVVNGKIFVCGGSDAEMVPSNDVFCFNPQTMSWSTVTPMPNGRSYAQVVSPDRAVYVIGGYEGKKHCPDIYVFHPETNKWNLDGSLNSPKIGLGAAVISAPF
ncbi:kelch repeat protein [Ancylostoma caninum]|uniref:Kelch repeat protein n=1 Tax=Ancylostoma caninum TaxID=29170 RepID=A0A368FSI5_ANCCA|nr:kelch repeat protein [Ancylostoma caninum]